MKLKHLLLIFLVALSYTAQGSQYDAELLALTNAERQNAGLPALTLSPQLDQAAQNHAQDMAINNYFSHTGLNGFRSSKRAEGFDPATFLSAVLDGTKTVNVVQGDSTAHVAENSLMGDGKETANTLDDLFVGGTGYEWFVGGASEANGANIFMGGGGNNTYWVGPGLTQADLDSDPDFYTQIKPGSNDIVIIDEKASGDPLTEIIYMEGVRDLLLDPKSQSYDASYTGEKKIASHGRVGNTDYEVVYKNGMKTYVVDLFDASGKPRATIQYDDCGPLELTQTTLTPEPKPEPEPSDSTGDTTTPPVTDASVFAPFAGKTWIFSSEKGTDEVTFNATPIDGAFLGSDTKNQLWGVGYDAEEGIYLILRVEEIAGKLNYITYTFTCNNCTNTTGQFFVIYDFGGSTQTVDGYYSASGHIKSVTTVSDNDTLPVTVSEVPEPASWQTPIDYYRDEQTGDIWQGVAGWHLPSVPTNGELPQDIWKYGLRAIYLAKYACQSSEVRDWMPTNIANGIYYCTNHEDKLQTSNYLRTLADQLQVESNTRSSNLRAQLPVLDSEPSAGQTPIDYYRNEKTGDVWGSEPAYRLPKPSNLPEDLWKYGLRSLYLAKYACQSAEVRDWMPINIANGIYYCTNPEDRDQTIGYLLTLADELEHADSCLRVKRPNSPEEQLFDADFIDFSPTTAVE